MKKKDLFVGLFVALGLTACTDTEILDQESRDGAEVQSRALFSNEVNINWNEEHQVIDGFGVAQAGWAADLFTYPQRDEVASLLFGESGLDINMLRGQVFPHYWDSEADSTYHIEDDVDMPLNDPYFQTATADDLDRRGQLWVSKVAYKNYNVNKLFFSTWTPPAFMKTNGARQQGSLKPESYQMFANYLAGFCKAYKQAGLDVYAMSPVNEPNFATPDWNSCKWAEADLAKFIVENMGPTFEREGLNAKIVFGEVAQWSTLLLGQLNLVSAKKYVENVIKADERVVQYADVAAGHGYDLPNIPYEFPIEPYDVAASKGLNVWLTEISTTYDTFDASMDNGIKWAEKFYKFLAKADVNALIWWAGARPGSNNEALIQLNDGNYVVTKRYEVFGNYTRYIKSGSVRITADKSIGAPSGLLISSYKKGNEWVVVAVNKSSKEISTTIKLSGKEVEGGLQPYLTDASHKWAAQETVQPGEANVFSITLPATSIITYTGVVK